MAKPQGMPSHKALPLVALLMYAVKLVYFAEDPSLVNATVVQGLLSALTPLSIIAGAILLFKMLEVSGAMKTILQWLKGISIPMLLYGAIVGVVALLFTG